MVEAVPLAVLTFVLGTLVVAHAWAVVDTRNEASAAAHAGVRAFVEAPAGQARGAARAAARAVLADSRSAERSWQVRVIGRPERCRPVTVRVTGRVPGLGLPWLARLAVVPVDVSHTEVVDPYRSGLAGPADCDG